MKELKLNGRTYLSTKRAAEITGYTTDYVGQLARGGKVDAQLVGRNWYIEEESIKKHKFGEAAVVVKKLEEEPAAPALEVLVQSAEENDIELNKVPEEVEVVENIESHRDEDPVVAMESVWQEWYKAQRSVPAEEEEVFLRKSSIEEVSTNEVEEVSEEVPITRVRENSRPIIEHARAEGVERNVEQKESEKRALPKEEIMVPTRSWGGAGLFAATAVTLLLVAGVATLAEIAMVRGIEYPLAASYQAIRDYVLGIQRI